MNIQWQLQTFDELTNQALYALLALRSRVFVVEQACVYLDLDGIDQHSVHLLGYEQGQLVAYLRVFVQGEETVIGRIVTDPGYRGQGVARQIMAKVIDFIGNNSLYPRQVYLMAQEHLQLFYQSFGFITQSQPFDEDGIMHVDMRLCLNPI